jgi:hypothetical protein
MAAQLDSCSNLRPSQMNRLQRSMVSKRVASVAKDSTASAAAFLNETLTAFDAYLGRQIVASNSAPKVRIPNINADV